MLQRLLYFIAGVDRELIARCPPTDRIWAMQIGFSLCLSFLVVFGVSYYALGYIVGSTALRSSIAVVIALTVMMFDRALFQSDWFVQGAFWLDDDQSGTAGEGLRRSVWQFVRIAARLAISLGLAWVIALFLELALFSDAISQKIDRDRVAGNRPIFEQIDKYASGLDREIAESRSQLTAIEQHQRELLAQAPVPSENPAAADPDVERELKALAEREVGVRGEVRELEETIREQSLDMSAEQFGEKLRPTNSGRAGAGRRYELAKKQKEAAEILLQSRQAELSDIVARRERIKNDAAARVAADLAQREEQRQEFAAKRAAIQNQVDTARANFQMLESQREAKVQRYRERTLEGSFVQQRKDSNDPLVRLTAYQALKSDPQEGPAITLFSWMIRLFVVFLEIVPVVTKIFFSPPSMYAINVQSQLKSARVAARSMTWKLADAEPERDRHSPEPVAPPIEPSQADHRVTPIFPRSETPERSAPPETARVPSNPVARRRWGLPLRRAKEEYPAPTNDQTMIAAIPVPAEIGDKAEARLVDEVAIAPAAPADEEPQVEQAVPVSQSEDGERLVVVYNGGGVRDVGPSSLAATENEIATPRRA
ncbi:DUF4407 domain-containing protein [Rhodopseudomonas sp. WA056]|uniref:DUF4407 domain-containing protein n=1 Tax=Rhodopseudomonas sp. WA056 TaxID=2269367 RepID=UPI0013E0A968|nr:DUF4407 domain-containing protein [Rhodopseudomonas sp. WA056]NEW86059.1 DUF4407 domain-containing protein [Rhodopseudomonas sp. WA056]